MKGHNGSKTTSASADDSTPFTKWRGANLSDDTLPALLLGDSSLAQWLQ